MSSITVPFLVTLSDLQGHLIAVSLTVVHYLIVSVVGREGGRVTVHRLSYQRSYCLGQN